MRGCILLLAALASAGCLDGPGPEAAASDPPLRFASFGYSAEGDLFGETVVEADGRLEALDARGVVVEVVAVEQCPDRWPAPTLASKRLLVGDLAGEREFAATLRFDNPRTLDESGLMDVPVVFAIAIAEDGTRVATTCLGP